MGEIAVFAEILSLIARLGAPPAPASPADQTVTAEVRLDDSNQRLSPRQRGLLAGSIACGACDARIIVAQNARRRDPAPQIIRTQAMSGQRIEAQGARAYREQQGTGTEFEPAHADMVIDLNAVR